MTTRQKLIKNIIEATKAFDYNDEILAKAIDNELTRIENVTKEIRFHKEKIREYKTEFDAKIADQQAKIKKIQNNCTHEYSTYHSDPAGGSDSYYECNICEGTFV